MSISRAFDPFPPDDFFDPDDPALSEVSPSVRPEPVARMGAGAVPGVGAGVAAGVSLADIAEKIRPTVLAAERTLPVAHELTELFPLGGIARGSRVSLRGTGATTLCMAMLAHASQQGSWIAVLGVPSWGWGAAVSAGWSLSRCVFVEQPPPAQWGTAMAALVDALDIVVVDPSQQIANTDARRLAARARERGSIIVDLALDSALGGGALGRDRDGEPQRARSRWPIEADLTMTARTQHWSGLDQGAGHLRDRELHIETLGRRGAARPQSVVMSVSPTGALHRQSSSSTAAPGAHSAAPRHLRAVG